MYIIHNIDLNIDVLHVDYILQVYYCNVQCTSFGDHRTWTHCDAHHP